jgi:2,3-bisphosphoglycerate-independent phosphoglycerate mutase
VEAFVPVTDHDVPVDLVEHADRALYASKRAGRDRIFSFDDAVAAAGRLVTQAEQVS